MSVATWIWIAASFLVGIAVGVIATILVRRGNDAEQRLRRLRREFDQYQGDVGHHFSQTAEVLTRLRNDFTQLYQHTERGAAALVGEDALQQRLRQLETSEGRDETPPPDTVSGTLPGARPGLAHGARDDDGAVGAARTADVDADTNTHAAADATTDATAEPTAQPTAGHDADHGTDHDAGSTAAATTDDLGTRGSTVADQADEAAKRA